MEKALDEAEARWQELRAAGVPAGSEVREMAALRRLLLDAGRWRIVYDITGG